jgi:hypothetical protein
MWSLLKKSIPILRWEVVKEIYIDYLIKKN